MRSHTILALPVSSLLVSSSPIPLPPSDIGPLHRAMPGLPVTRPFPQTIHGLPILPLQRHPTGFLSFAVVLLVRIPANRISNTSRKHGFRPATFGRRSVGGLHVSRPKNPGDGKPAESIGPTALREHRGGRSPHFSHMSVRVNRQARSGKGRLAPFATIR